MAKRPPSDGSVNASRIRRDQTTLKVTLEKQPGFELRMAGYLFDAAGNLLERAEVKRETLVLKQPEAALGRTRLFIGPMGEDSDAEAPSLGAMARIGAYEPVVRPGGQLLKELLVPGSILDHWLLCRCWVRGRVVKADSGRPVCGARVHICEVDKLWRWIVRLPDLDVLRLRDEWLKLIELPPLRVPPRPGPDPAPFARERLQLGPQPEPPDLPVLRAAANPSLAEGLNPVSATPIPLPLPATALTRLRSNSPHLVRETLVAHADLLLPYLCLWPSWLTFRCDEIAVVETDAIGRFETTVFYRCDGDKPDLYFWVEYEIAGSLETVYHPPIPCHTHWDYPCGSDVILRIDDDRVPACDDEPDLPGCVVQILSIGRQVSLSELHGPGAQVAQEGLTTSGQPFGGKLEPRVWFSRTTLRDGKNVRYYRWSCRRLTTGDGVPLGAPGPWTPLTRTVVRHYAFAGPGGITHQPYALGPVPVGPQANVFEIKPADVPPGGIEWTVVDEREDLASGHFESHKLGVGADACARALDGAGKYELKLELFKNTGALVDWTAEGIGLQVTDVPAPFGTGVVTAVNAPPYNRVVNAAGHTVAFRMVLRVDNNCCRAAVHPVSGTSLTTTPCGFYEYLPGANVSLSFSPHHPTGFATFSLSVRRGVATAVPRASVSGRVGAPSVATDDPSPPPRAYTLTPPSLYQESFPIAELLGPCVRAAYSEALHVWTMSQDGYNRLSSLDSFAHDGFALTPV